MVTKWELTICAVLCRNKPRRLSIPRHNINNWTIRWLIFRNYPLNWYVVEVSLREMTASVELCYCSGFLCPTTVRHRQINSSAIQEPREIIAFVSRFILMEDKYWTRLIHLHKYNSLPRSQSQDNRNLHKTLGDVTVRWHWLLVITSQLPSGQIYQSTPRWKDDARPGATEHNKMFINRDWDVLIHLVSRGDTGLDGLVASVEWECQGHGKTREGVWHITLLQ